MSRGKLHAVVAAFAVVVGLLALAPPASAGGDGTGNDSAGGRSMEIEAGYGGRYLAGRRLPVRITLTADQLLRGRIEVTVRDQTGTFSTPVEVPGGSAKEVLVVVPTPSTFEIRDVSVRLLVGDGQALAAEAQVEPLDDQQIVGLLPELAPNDLPGVLTLPMDAGSARFVLLDADTVATEGALDPISTITAGTEELRRLDPDTRRALLGWVDEGGRLVVDAAPGTEIDGLPSEWQPGDATRHVAGLGEVRLVGGAIAAQRWADVVEPAPTASIADLSQMGGFSSPPQLEATGDAVARDAGLQALDLPWLLAFLAAYVVLAGPVAWFVLRKRRPALGWIVIPTLAVVFTGASFVVGTDLRAGTRAAHGSILELGPAGARVTTIIGTVSRSGADGVSRFPAGWIGGAVDNSFFGNPAETPDIGVVSDSTGTEATIQLAAGGFGVVKGSGPSDAAPADGLVVEAHSEDGAVVGTIRNDLPFDVERVGVFLGRDGDLVGSIGAGETVDFAIEGNELRNGDPYSPPESRVWPAESGYNGAPDYQSIVNLGLWNETVLGAGVNARPRGVVTVVGWTRGFTPEVEVVGQGAPSGRTAVVTRAAVEAGDGIANGAARRELVRASDGFELPDEDVDVPVIGGLWQFSLPAGTDDDALTLDVPFYMARADVWDGTRWVTVDDDLSDRDPNNFNGDPTQIRHADLPDGIGADGVVWVRGWLMRDFPFDGSGLEITSGEA